MIELNTSGAVIRDGHILGWVRSGGCSNLNCLQEIADGRPWHAMPRYSRAFPQFHYASRAEGIAAIVAVSGLAHDEGCAVRRGRDSLAQEMRERPTDRYLIGAWPEWFGGDQESELCDCGQWDRKEIADALMAYAAAQEEMLTEQHGPEDFPVVEDYRADADRIRAGESPLHAHTREVLADPSSGAGAMAERPPSYWDSLRRVFPELARRARVAVVFDLESADAPMPVGIYLRTDEDSVLYRSPSGEVRGAPHDCVTIVSVEVS